MTLSPEQLGSLGQTFDEARRRLEQAGYAVGTGVATALAAVIIKLDAEGLSGEQLVAEAVTALGRHSPRT